MDRRQFAFEKIYRLESLRSRGNVSKMIMDSSHDADDSQPTQRNEKEFPEKIHAVQIDTKTEFLMVPSIVA
jgi:hypothetical protein